MMSAMSRSSVATSLSSPASLGPALVVALAGLAGGGCGGTSQTAIVIAPPPPPSTVGVLVGNLCEGQACTCRDPAAPADGGAGVPEAGAKRFEIRLGPTDAELWATVDDMTLYKSREQVSMCYYVDLGPGEHTVGLRASRDAGVQASMEIAEYGPGAQSWYETFRFACGVKGYDVIVVGAGHAGCEAATGGRAHGRQRAAADPEHRPRGLDELQPRGRRRRQGPPRQGGRRPRRIDGACDRPRGHPVPPAQHTQGPGRALEPRPDRQGRLRAERARHASSGSTGITLQADRVEGFVIDDAGPRPRVRGVTTSSERPTSPTPSS
jgi:hypothetical protein